MALKYASSPFNGGALFVEGDLILKNVLFQYNYENGNLKALTASNNAIVEIIGNVNLKN